MDQSTKQKVNIETLSYKGNRYAKSVSFSMDNVPDTDEKNCPYCVF